MSLNVTTLDLVRQGDVLATRDRGRTVGRAALDSLPDSVHLLLNFAGVAVASPPFLDELLVTLRPATVGGDTGRLVVAVGLNDDVRESLEMVLERRKMVMAELRDDQVELLGGPDQLHATVRAAIALGEKFTAPELAEQLKMKLPAVHQRLKALTDAGVLAREIDPTSKRGVRHSYVTPKVEPLRKASLEAKTLQPA